MPAPELPTTGGVRILRPPRPGDHVRVWDAKGGLFLPGDLADESDPSSVRIKSYASLMSELLDVSEFPDVVIRYGDRFINALFNGHYLIFGSGNGNSFLDFTSSLDVFVHEMGHVLVMTGPRLPYEGEGGAINEHLCDVLAVCVSQWAYGEPLNWRIGEDVVAIEGGALRDMLNPGTGRVVGDDQIGHMDDLKYLNAACDAGGVHVNSGILNRAFALFVSLSGLPSWEAPLTIWRWAMSDLDRYATFQHLMLATMLHAAPMGLGDELATAWDAVGLSL